MSTGGALIVLFICILISNHVRKYRIWKATHPDNDQQRGRNLR